MWICFAGSLTSSHLTASRRTIEPWVARTHTHWPHPGPLPGHHPFPPCTYGDTEEEVSWWFIQLSAKGTRQIYQWSTYITPFSTGIHSGSLPGRRLPSHPQHDGDDHHPRQALSHVLRLPNVPVLHQSTAVGHREGKDGGRETTKDCRCVCVCRCGGRVSILEWCQSDKPNTAESANRLLHMLFLRTEMDSADQTLAARWSWFLKSV